MLTLNTSKNLTIALFAAYGGPYAFAAGLKLIQDCLAFLQPQLLRWLLSYISAYQSARPDGIEQNGAPSPFEGFAIAITMFVAAITQTIILHQVSPYMHRKTQYSRISLSISNGASRLACAYAQVS